MNTEQPAIVTVPTEMARQDGFIDSAILLGSALAVWWFALRGVPVWLFVPPMLCLSVFVLTGEPAGDVPFVGAIASGLRSKLGMRRAHEWCLAFLHYTAVRTWPDFRKWSNTTWQNSRFGSKMQTLYCSHRSRMPRIANPLSKLRRSFARS
jgi:hypothetical protein